MFGKIRQSNFFASSLLLLLCCYIIRLYWQGDITLYIHPRYAIFALVMAVLGAIMLLIGIVVEVRRRGHVHQKPMSGIVDSIAVVVVMLALILPAQPLSSRAIEQKPLNTTNRATVVANDLPCSSDKPESIDTWVYVINTYPARCYEGQEITLAGFVLEPTENALPDGMYYVGRAVMYCCVIDARPYALPVEKGSFGNYPKDTWLSIDGKIQIKQVNGTNQAVVVPDSVQETKTPDDPYNYLNNNAQEVQTVLPIQ
jgi:putative membrane protein